MLALHILFLQAYSQAKWLNQAPCSSTEGCIEPLCVTVLAQMHDMMLPPNVFILK